MYCEFRSRIFKEGIEVYKCTGGVNDGLLCENEYEDEFSCDWYEAYINKFKPIKIEASHLILNDKIYYPNDEKEKINIINTLKEHNYDIKIIEL